MKSGIPLNCIAFFYGIFGVVAFLRVVISDGVRFNDFGAGGGAMFFEGS